MKTWTLFTLASAATFLFSTKGLLVQAQPVSTLAPSGVEFVGAGIVSCPFEDYVLGSCVAEFFGDLDECANVQACAQIIEGPSNATHLSIVLPCKCARAAGCAASCTFTPTEEVFVPDTGNDLVGPGYVSCPVDDYTAFPCFPSQTSDTCSNVSACLNASQDISYDDTFSNVFFPLPCECVTFTNCPATCVLIPGLDAPTVPPVSGNVTFVGPGVVTCPISAVLQQACVPAGSFYDLTSSSSCSEECLPFADSELYGYEEGDAVYEFPLWCSCMELVDCPSSCNFTEYTGSSTGSSASLAPTSSSGGGRPSSVSPSTSIDIAPSVLSSTSEPTSVATTRPQPSQPTAAPTLFPTFAIYTDTPTTAIEAPMTRAPVRVVAAPPVAIATKSTVVPTSPVAASFSPMGVPPSLLRAPTMAAFPAAVPLSRPTTSSSDDRMATSFAIRASAQTAVPFIAIGWWLVGTML